MRVIVIKDDGTYYVTIAFAIHLNGDNTEFFILNENDEFERVFEYKITENGKEKRVLFSDVFSSSDEDFIKKGNYAGYRRFVNDKKLLDRIRNGEKNIFNYEDMIYYQSIKGSRAALDAIVDNEKSCKVLLNMCDRFQDSPSIEKYTYDEKNKHLTFVFGEFGGFEQLTLDFYGVEQYNIVEDPDLGIFYLIASIFYEDGMVYFVADECETKEDLWEGYTYVVCKRIEYSFVVKKYNEVS